MKSMEKLIHDLQRGGYAVWIPDGEQDMSVFAEYPHESEGVGVYYNEKDGSCAEPVYVRFFRSAQGMSLELTSAEEYSAWEKERLKHLLRR